MNQCICKLEILRRGSEQLFLMGREFRGKPIKSRCTGNCSALEATWGNPKNRDKLKMLTVIWKSESKAGIRLEETGFRVEHVFRTDQIAQETSLREVGESKGRVRVCRKRDKISTVRNERSKKKFSVYLGKRQSSTKKFHSVTTHSIYYLRY